MTDQEIKDKLPPLLKGKRVLPDKTPVSPIQMELNCICGEVLSHAEYMHEGKIIILVNPCPHCQE